MVWDLTCAHQIATRSAHPGACDAEAMVCATALTCIHACGPHAAAAEIRLNKCGAISPRYDIAAKDIEAWVGRLLPSRQVSQCTQLA